ncbi:MAG: pilus assembly protein [Thiotrichales bacterium]
MKQVMTVVKLFMVSCAASFAGIANVAVAGTFDISQKPMFLVSDVAPNIALTMDDSGSMAWAFVPDGISGAKNQLFRASKYNGMYYNPEITYKPPVNADGVELQTSFSNAWIHGFDHSYGSVNLGSNYRATRTLYPESSTPHKYVSDTVSDLKHYYVFDASRSNCDGSSDDVDCYQGINVGATSGPGGTDERQNFANWYSFYRTRNLAVISATSQAFQQLSSKTRIAWQALNKCAGFSTNCKGYDGVSHDSRINIFTSQEKSTFYDWLFRLPATGGTPLLRAAERAGEMYKTNRPYETDPNVTDSQSRLECRQNYSIVMTDGIWNSGYADNAGDEDNTSKTLPDGEQYSISAPFQKQNSYNNLADIAFKYWSEDLHALPSSDQLAYLPIQDDEVVVSGGTTVTVPPYWNPKNDPATWQHVVTFTVGLGLNIQLQNNGLVWEGDTHEGDGYAALLTGSSLWPNTGSNYKPGNVYDLWHAAINGRGEFFGAETPDDIVKAFKQTIQRIQARQGSASSVSFNSGSASSFSQVFKAKFDSADWSGSLQALPVSNGEGNLTCTNEARGEICPAAWEADCNLTGGLCATTGTTIAAQDWDSERVILANDGTGGVPFRWGSLSADQQSQLSGNDGSAAGQSRLKYVRGDRAQEQAQGGNFRNRKHVLGDIVNSSPVYVGTPAHLYADTWKDAFHGTVGDETLYSQFVADHATRKHVVYVGANDGLLHGFQAGSFDSNGLFNEYYNDGREVLAYAPAPALTNIPDLSNPDYSSLGLHKYFVDGKLSSADVFFANQWHSMLIGSLGRGGQGIFALDVTDPDNFSESIADEIALWEFTDADDADLGMNLSEPKIVRLHNGRWAVLTGNGYNSTASDGAVSSTGNAVLFILDIEDGTVLAKLDTGVGQSNPNANSLPNGLSDVTPVDLDGDGIVDYAYAGDLLGNVWRFDLTSEDPFNWSIETYGNASETPLFIARDGESNPTRQPITSELIVEKHPLGIGYGVTVSFGTGKYFEQADNTADQSTYQSFYTVWDHYFPAFSTVGVHGSPVATSAMDRDNLQAQAITTEVLEGDRKERATSNNEVDWDAEMGWYIDLLEGGQTSNGEMVVSGPLLLGKTIVFSTLIPSADACSTGSSGWVMAMDITDGGTPKASPFKEKIDATDETTVGLNFVDSAPWKPAYISGKLFVPQSTGEVETPNFYIGVLEGRQTFIELQ